MKKNESTTDRVIRVIVAIVLFFIAYYQMSGAWQVIFYVLAAIALITALTGFCLLYKMFGISTCKTTTPTTPTTPNIQ